MKLTVLEHEEKCPWVRGPLKQGYYLVTGIGDPDDPPIPDEDEFLIQANEPNITITSESRYYGVGAYWKNDQDVVVRTSREVDIKEIKVVPKPQEDDAQSTKP